MLSHPVSAVRSSAGKNVLQPIFRHVISTGSNIIVVEIKAHTSPSSRIVEWMATLSADSGPTVPENRIRPSRGI